MRTRGDMGPRNEVAVGSEFRVLVALRRRQIDRRVKVVEIEAGSAVCLSWRPGIEGSSKTRIAVARLENTHLFESMETTTCAPCVSCERPQGSWRPGSSPCGVAA
ncbi:MAG TPA: hypothetical protein VH309_06650 [Elusimicrobiota bacterium]|jgi:hypothetical protein|nr:hypothetical protein [Elusimicrobiota bacterium]